VSSKWAESTYGAIGRFFAERSLDILTRWIFLRGLGAIYLIAFVSLWVQITGLIGARGILPATELMSQARSAVEANGVGLDRFRMLPTFCWFGDSDAALHLQCGVGTILAILLIIGIAPRVCLAGMWLLYLSVATVGQDFLGFQWDNLLLETGLMAILFAPGQILPRPSRELAPSRAAMWLLRLLLFKLMFLSGVVKLTSGDPLWRNLTALARHYETQPLPNARAWYAHQMPMWFHQTSCVIMFGIELLAPFLLFAPRSFRLSGAIAMAALQFGILVTGNFTFFNWLTILLCVIACDDATWSRILPRRLANRYSAPPVVREHPVWRRILLGAVSVFFVAISSIQVIGSFGALPSWTAPVLAVHRWIAPFRSINSYGLFAVMTPNRPEIVVEGSNDGREWKEYSFPHKPGALNRRPTFVAPHQPRLDWQMWFAALGDVRGNEWFVNFCVRLLEGSPQTLALLEKNPFPNAPPKYIRAQLYEYRFTTRAERRETGNWWKRELKGEYLPPISLEMMKPKQ
jgi:lipase maturation factor 1